MLIRNTITQIYIQQTGLKTFRTGVKGIGNKKILYFSTQ